MAKSYALNRLLLCCCVLHFICNGCANLTNLADAIGQRKCNVRSHVPMRGIIPYVIDK